MNASPIIQYLIQNLLELVEFVKTAFPFILSIIAVIAAWLKTEETIVFSMGVIGGIIGYLLGGSGGMLLFVVVGILFGLFLVNFLDNELNVKISRYFEYVLKWCGYIILLLIVIALATSFFSIIYSYWD